LFAIPRTIIEKSQEIVFKFEFFVVLTNKIIHIDIRELKVDAVLQVKEHLVQDHLGTLFDYAAELNL